MTSSNELLKSTEGISSANRNLRESAHDSQGASAQVGSAITQIARLFKKSHRALTKYQKSPLRLEN